jgi:hypothetical protein
MEGAATMSTMTSGTMFRAIGFFDNADTLESSSILIYSELHAGLYTQRIWQDAALIKWLLKGVGGSWGA